MRMAVIAAFFLSPLLAFAGQQNYDVKVEGMTCESCVKSLTAALKKVPGIDAKSVKVVLSSKSASVSVTEDKKESAAQIKKAIEDAGYTVTSLHLVPSEPKRN